MANVYTGLFNNAHEYKKLERDLEDSGFRDSDYIVYINNDGNAQYVASVSVKNERQSEIAAEVFSKNQVVKTFTINNTDLNEMRDFEDVRKFITVHSKAEISQSPNLRIKSANKGIDPNLSFS